MSDVRPCLLCGSGNSAQVSRCWVCGADLLAATPPPGAASAPPPAATYDKSTRALQVVGWSSLLLGIGFTAILIAVELGLNWPGMLIPYAVIVLVAFVALGRTAWVQLQKKPTLAAPVAGGPEGAAAPRKGVTGPDVMQSVALGLAIAMAVIAGLMLLAVAAVVIFFLICLVLVSSSGMH